MKTVVKNEPIIFWQALLKRSAVGIQLALGRGHSKHSATTRTASSFLWIFSPKNTSELSIQLSLTVAFQLNSQLVEAFTFTLPVFILDCCGWVLG